MWVVWGRDNCAAAGGRWEWVCMYVCMYVCECAVLRSTRVFVLRRGWVCAVRCSWRGLRRGLAVLGICMYNWRVTTWFGMKRIQAVFANLLGCWANHGGGYRTHEETYGVRSGHTIGYDALSVFHISFLYAMDRKSVVVMTDEYHPTPALERNVTSHRCQFLTSLGSRHISFANEDVKC